MRRRFIKTQNATSKVLSAWLGIITILIAVLLALPACKAKKDASDNADGAPYIDREKIKDRLMIEDLEKVYEKKTSQPKKSSPKSSPKADSKQSRAHKTDTELSKLQYLVARENGTEPPFDNAYWDNKAEGIYIDIVSGEVLFSSREKYASGTGWPSFYASVNPQEIKEEADNTLGMRRVEVRSAKSDIHLGHVFDDGPKPTGKRYCINSAALQFIAKENLLEAGYDKYLSLFE